VNIKEIPQIQERINTLDYLILTPEYRQFDCSEVFSNISDNNKAFLMPMIKPLNIYLNCLKDVKRWKNHLYHHNDSPIYDNDYQHTLEMLKISHSLKKLNINSINFDDVEIMILAHDGGEIVTDDMCLYHGSEIDDYVSKIKDLEPRVFTGCVLRLIKDKDLLSNRAKICRLYKNYNARHENHFDKESHLVKFIDMLEGDYFGLKNVYSKKRLNEIFTQDNLPADPDKIISKTIEKQFSQLEIVFKGIDNQSDKQKIFNYFDNNYFKQYNQPEYSYQHIYEDFLDKKKELFKSL